MRLLLIRGGGSRLIRDPLSSCATRLGLSARLYRGPFCQLKAYQHQKKILNNSQWMLRGRLSGEVGL